MPFAFGSIEFTDFTKFPLEPTGRKGISHYVLVRAADGVGLIHVAEFEPYADTSPEGPQIHDFWEYVFIIEGSMIDLTLNQELTKRVRSNTESWNAAWSLEDPFRGLSSI